MRKTNVAVEQETARRDADRLFYRSFNIEEMIAIRTPEAFSVNTRTTSKPADEA